MMHYIFLILLLSFVIELKGWNVVNNDIMVRDKLYKLFDKSNNNLTESKENKPEWLTQKLDHFDRYNTKTWKQRYFTNETFFKTGGPVFLLIGGESPISSQRVSSGNWITYAKQFKALLFNVEHRFYGQSHPTSDLSTENLRKYLSSELALEDLAAFIQAMNKKYELSPDTKWIVFGGSYAGSLAAWLRMKHPKLVHGAVSSSAPLLAQMDFPDYLKIVIESLRSYSNNCVEAIRKGFDKITDLIRHHFQSILSCKLNCCDPFCSLNNQKHLSLLYQRTYSVFTRAVQYSSRNEIPGLSGNTSIEGVCNVMTNQSLGSPLDRLSKAISISNNNTCLTFNYKNNINVERNITWTDSSERQWLFQTCNEFGFFQTPKKVPFIYDKVPLDYFVDKCEDVFGPEYDEEYIKMAVNKTNAIYHGLDLKVSRVIFVHGSLDPWSALGITSSKDPEVPVIFIKGTSHCDDMKDASPNDLPALTAARIQIGKIIRHWLYI